jgi:hypothetical protein
MKFRKQNTFFVGETVRVKGLERNDTWKHICGKKYTVEGITNDGLYQITVINTRGNFEKIPIAPCWLKKTCKSVIQVLNRKI